MEQKQHKTHNNNTSKVKDHKQIYENTKKQYKQNK